MLYLKDPDAVIDLKLTWAVWLSEGDTISDSEWFITPAGLVMDEVKTTHDTTSATVWLSGGVANTTYQATNRVTTTQGRVNDQTITVRVRQR